MVVEIKSYLSRKVYKLCLFQKVYLIEYKKELFLFF